jgi:hypothetical protein
MLETLKNVEFLSYHLLGGELFVFSQLDETFAPKTEYCITTSKISAGVMRNAKSIIQLEHTLFIEPDACRNSDPLNPTDPASGTPDTRRSNDCQIGKIVPTSRPGG